MKRLSFFGQVAAGLVFIFLVFAWINPISAQTPEVPSVATAKKADAKALTSDEIEKKINELKDEVSAAENSESEEIATQRGIPLRDLQELSITLKATQSIYIQLLTALNKKTALQEDATILRQKLSAEDQIAIPQKPPYTLSFYDSLLAELAVARQQKATAGLALQMSKRSLENIDARFEKAAAEWRALKEKIEKQQPGSADQNLKWRLKKFQAEKDKIEATFYLEKAKQANHDVELQLAQLREDQYQQQVTWVRNRLAFDETDLQKQLDSIDSKRNWISERLKKLSIERKQAEDAWLDAQAQMAKSTAPEDTAAAEAALKARESWRASIQKITEQTEDMAMLLVHQADILRNRSAIIKGEVSSQALAEWREQFQNYDENLKSVIGLQQNYQTNLQSQSTSLERQLSEKDLNPQVKIHLQNQLQAIQKLAEQRFEYISMLLATAQMDTRLLEEIDSKLRKLPWTQKVSGILDQIQGVWTYEIYVIDNRAVTVKKLIVSIFILIIGILVAKFIVRVLTRRLAYYARLKDTTASAIRKMFSIMAYLLVFLFALRMVNIPLAAFAFLGGAVAIGLGFGAQNLINNFISGFIIMGERPISIGDLIEVEGILGQVEDIGARSTRVRTGENIHILVPNSSFLERNITNWTLSDQKIRTRVSVGVIYGSPVEEVKKLLLEATKASERVLRNPEPFVLFADFGDNALIFEVYFWISIRQIIERRMIESHLRFRIDALFREAGIVIAFPQRDVHLDTQQPLELRLIEMKDKSEKNGNPEEK
jgi:small-conductance mechanosensitive channel